MERNTLPENYRLCRALLSPPLFSSSLLLSPCLQLDSKASGALLKGEDDGDYALDSESYMEVRRAPGVPRGLDGVRGSPGGETGSGGHMGRRGQLV